MRSQFTSHDLIVHAPTSFDHRKRNNTPTNTPNASNDESIASFLNKSFVEEAKGEKQTRNVKTTEVVDVHNHDIIL